MNIKIETGEIETIWSCEHCGLRDQISYESLDDIIGSLRESGWPICLDCGEDLDFQTEQSVYIDGNKRSTGK